EPARIGEPEVAALLQRRRDLLLRASHQVHRPVQVLDQVITIEGDGDVGEIAGGAEPVAGCHVHAQLRQLLRAAPWASKSAVKRTKLSASRPSVQKTTRGRPRSTNIEK